MSNQSSGWGSRIGLILAMAGNAVGLGNFLRFPVQAVQNGGGAFIIPYLVCFVIMGIPLLWIEWSMGRYGGRFGNHSTPFILDNMTKRKFWKYFGVFGIFTNIAVAAYYCYIESWTLSYMYHSVVQTFVGMDQTAVTNFFTDYVNIEKSTSGLPYEAIVFYIVCLLLNTWILSKGLSGGVEKVAKIGMPLLILFGVFLAIKGFTLGTSGASADCTDCDSFLGLSFLWEPQFTSLYDPKVWFAAAGQIFFTLSVGMGTIHCYASYVRSKDDIALNAMTAGWMNGFVEIVLGASIVIPIAVGYLGLDWVRENAGFSMAFQTMPFLFGKWGAVLGTLAGFFWFGLLFFAGITSSLAMGTPWIGFLKDEFKWSEKKAAWSFGLIVLIVGLPTVLFYNEGWFGEYDYWAGTASLVIFALAESIIFSYIFGINKGWDEINRGSDMRVPTFFKYIIKYVTPSVIFLIFIFTLAAPKDNDYKKAINEGWELDPGSLIGKIKNKGINFNRDYFSDVLQAENTGTVSNIITKKDGSFLVELANSKKFYYNSKGYIKPVKEGMTEITFDSVAVTATQKIKKGSELMVKTGDIVNAGDVVAKGSFTNVIFYVNMSRLLLLALFVFIAIMVFRASNLRLKKEKI